MDRARSCRHTSIPSPSGQPEIEASFRSFSVAVWIGYIALWGVAVQTGVVMASLVPILWSTGVGSDVMKPIAAPIVGGMVTSTIHVLFNTPVMFYILKVRALRPGRPIGSTFN